MNPEDVVEAFVSTIVAVVMLVVLASILAPDIGQQLVDFMPAFVKVVAYIAIPMIIGAMLYQLFEQA